MAAPKAEFLAPLVVARTNVVFHPGTMVLRHNFSDVVVSAPPAPVVTAPPPPTAPILDPPAQEAQLKQVPVPAIDFAAQGGIKYRPLSTWLADPALAVIQCTQDTLRISLRAAAPPGVRLLPFVDALPGAITAKLANLPGVESPPLAVELNEAERRLNLSLKFPDASAQALYDALVAAMTNPASKVGVTLTYSHQYAVMTTAEGLAPIMMNPNVVLSTSVFEPHGPIVAHDATIFTQGHVLVSAPPSGPTPAPPQPHPHSAQLAQTVTLPLYRSRDTLPDPYPDLPKPETAKTWSSYAVENSDLQIFFKAAARPDWFYYLPAAYKLGFYTDEQGALQRPIGAQNYLNGTDDYRVKVKLIALPYIDDAVREKLRAYICSTVLNHVLPYVRLIPAAGVSCKFGSDFSGNSGSPAGGQSLPATIRFTASDLAPEKRLAFEFDMAAFDYALFGELLRHGLRGTLFFDDGTELHQGVEVRMRLEDLIANSVDIAVAPDIGKNTAAVTLGNRLDFPVQVLSGAAFFVKRGVVFPEMVFSAENVNLFQAGGTKFGPKGDPTATSEITIKPVGKAWNEVSVSLGTIGVQAGSADDWLNRVNQDPSLQPQEFTVQVSLIVPEAAKATIPAVEIKLYRDGDVTLRKQRQVPTNAPTWDLPVAMSLAELMGSGGQRRTFSLEYYSLYGDGSLGLPQRVELDPSAKDLPVIALLETAASEYTLVYDDEHGEQRVKGDRAATETRIAGLRQAGRRWTLTAHNPAATGAPAGTSTGPAGGSTTGSTSSPSSGRDASGTGTTPGPAGTTPAPSGPLIAIVTDLLADRFIHGKLKQVFVVMQPVAEGAPSTSFSFDAGHQTAQNWHAPDSTVPPFKYRITFLYEGGVSKESTGTETSPMLILDPPTLS
jgi:hypothetical protein